MRAIVIGSAAGGGFPQWNCACANCAAVRSGSGRSRPRTQDSVALSAAADATRWILLNASPDIHAQIRANEVLAPRHGRASPIAAVVLTNGDLDHVLGLLSLRESHRFAVYATPAVIEGLVGRNALFRTLARFEGQVAWRPLQLDRDVPLADAAGAPLGATVRAVPIPGKLPVHLEGVVARSRGDNVGLLVRDATAGTKIAYATSVGAVGDFFAEANDAAALLVDGTFWSSDELARTGVGTARAESMAHLPIGGDDGSLIRLRDARAHRRIYTHLNNTNPVLMDGSAERGEVEAAGWEIAFDGMEILG